MDAIEIFGLRENLEKVCKKAWELGNFGSTCIDGNELDVFVRDYTTKDGISELIDYAQENSCYINGLTAKFLITKYGFKEG
jgi:hypothetical protein